jgi:hypothetical protein
MNGSTNFLLNPWAGEAGPPDTRVYRLYKKLNDAWEPQLSNPFLQSVTPLTIKSSLDRTRIRYHIWQNSDTSEVNTISFGWGDATDTTAQDPYDFLFMNMDEPYDKMYHRNFNTLVIDEV